MRVVLCWKAGRSAICSGVRPKGLSCSSWSAFSASLTSLESESLVILPFRISSGTKASLAPIPHLALLAGIGSMSGFSLAILVSIISCINSYFAWSLLFRLFKGSFGI